MNSSFNYLEWDSDFFKMPVYSSKCLEDLKEIFENDKSSDIMVYLYCKSKVESIEKYLCDERVTFAVVIKEIPNISIPLNEGEFNYVNSIEPAIVELAIDSSRLSRFRIDSKISPEKVDELYRIWATSAIINKKVLVFRTRGVTRGLLIYSGAKSNYQIEIIAVSSQVRGRGIGRALICKMIKDLSIKDDLKIKVVTQGANLEAKKLYESLGFKSEKVEYVYHLHKSSYLNRV